MLVAVVREESGIAPPWKDGASQLGENGRPPLWAIIEIDDGGGEPLAAALELSPASGQFRVEGILMGKVFLSREVAQNLKAFDVRLRASKGPAGAGAKRSGGWMADVMQRGSFAGSRAVDLVTRFDIVAHGGGAFEPRSAQFDDGESFLGADDIFDQGDLGILKVHEHARSLAVRTTGESKKLSAGRGQYLGSLFGELDALMAQFQKFSGIAP